ncbi:MAG: CpsB/CapC family capsule biosynthesis tyrosine phosphatase [Candidatus Competibacteraceae bacterium]
MIDLHCHLLPGIDDGAADLATALAMAKVAVADGISLIACTPHIYPGLYDNTAPGIERAVAELRVELEAASIPLDLTCGADTHLVPELPAGLRTGRIPSLHGSRYFLLEPPHHVAPPQFAESVFTLQVAGYVPIITHPERLTWISHHYEVFCSLARSGVWMQVTAGSLTGRFGKSARYWGERLLDEGLVHILATDAHGVERRPPILSEGFQVAESYLGAEEAVRLVKTRPQGILDNLEPSKLIPPPGLQHNEPATAVPNQRGSFLTRWFRRVVG